MILVEKGSRFELLVIDYEYPDSKESDDANWVVVEINVADKNGVSWSAKDACLRTFELVKLRDWFQSIKDDEEHYSSIFFTENELSFRYETKFILEIALDFRFHPKGCDYNVDVDSEYVIGFQLNKKILSGLIESFSDYIKKFPEKNFS